MSIGGLTAIPGQALAALADIAVRHGQPGQAISLLHTALDGVKDSGPASAEIQQCERALAVALNARR